jgi:hypothetical protein
VPTPETDPWRLSGQIERAARSWRAWRRALLTGAGWDDDPFAEERTATTRATFRWVGSLDASDPLREPLRRWVYRLLEQRVNRDYLVEVRRLGSAGLHPLARPLGGEWSLAEMLRRALAEPARRKAWLEAWAEKTSPLSSAVGILWQRRREVARGLGLDHPDEIESPAPELTEVARGWLEASDDLWTALRVRDMSRYLEVASGTGAEEGWPARLTLRSVTGLLGAPEWLSGVDFQPGRLPKALVPASFPRALARLGAAWSDALGPSDQPFVVAHDAYGIRRRALGALWGTLPLGSEFVRRQLSVPAYRRSAHLRALAVVLLSEVRRAALGVLLRAAALGRVGGSAEELPGLSRQALGVTLRPEWAGALVRLHVDTPHRFAGWLLGVARAELLRETHDSDWFRNPRAIEELRAEAGSPAPGVVEPGALARAQDVCLGWLCAALG